MSNITLREEQWAKIIEHLRQESRIYMGKDVRLFIEAVLWILRTGAQWRELPEKYGKWNSVFKRFSRWSKHGVWERLFKFFADNSEFEDIFIDSTVVRAHPCAAGASKKEGEQSLGRSRGGFSTKIHISVGGSNNPLKIILTGGQAHDAPQGEKLIEDLSFKRAIGDKGYDSDPLREKIREKDAIPVIPPRSNRKEQYEYDKELYKKRYMVECFINKLKQFRRVFSRFEKLDRNYLAFVYLASVLIWLR